MFVPVQLLECSEIIRRFETARERSLNALAEIVARGCNVRAALGSSEADLTKDAHVCLGLDAELDDWAINLPSRYNYRTVVADKGIELYEDYYHVYNDNDVIADLNTYRSTRILLNAALIVYFQGQLQKPAEVMEQRIREQMQAGLESSLSLLLKLGSDICASVPCHLGLIPNSGQRKPPQCWSAMMITQPLAVLASMPWAPDKLRLWALGRLNYLANEFGNGSCHNLAETIHLRPVLFGQVFMLRVSDQHPYTE